MCEGWWKMTWERADAGRRTPMLIPVIKPPSSIRGLVEDNLVKENPHSGSQPSFSRALVGTAGRQIPASAGTKKGIEKGGLIHVQENLGTRRRREERANCHPCSGKARLIELCS